MKSFVSYIIVIILGAASLSAYAHHYHQRGYSEYQGKDYSYRNPPRPYHYRHGYRHGYRHDYEHGYRHDYVPRRPPVWHHPIPRGPHWGCNFNGCWAQPYYNY